MGSAVYGPWWSLILRGIVLIGFGIAALAWPDITLAVMIALFGVFVVIDGILASVGAVANRQAHEHWGLSLLGGLAGIGIGLLIIAWPEITALALLYIIGAWAFVIGVFAVFAPIAYRGELQHSWLYVLGGLISIAIGIALFAYPVEGALALVWLIGIYAIGLGVIVALFGFRVRTAPAPAELT
jgi:uncharacterized membrane protein HdeD (DUF308 family)